VNEADIGDPSSSADNDASESKQDSSTSPASSPLSADSTDSLYDSVTPLPKDQLRDLYTQTDFESLDSVQAAVFGVENKYHPTPQPDKFRQALKRLAVEAQAAGHDITAGSLADALSESDSSADQRSDGNVTVDDIDAKDVALERATERFPHSENASQDDILEQAGVLQGEPEGYPYEYEDIHTALGYAFEVEQFFNDQLASDDTQVVYSGQGAHVYLYDEDPEYRYDEAARKVIVHALSEKRDIPIDEQVTTDEARVIRLPYSLHAGVSRVVTPVESPDFDFRTDAQPAFL